MSLMRTTPAGLTRVRVRAWHADQRVAHLTPTGTGRGPITPDEVRRCLDSARRWRYEAAVTAALGRADQVPFVDAGFVPTERLHLLVHTLGQIPDAPSTPGTHLRRGRRRDLDDVLAVDGAAFSGIWRLDRAGIDEALTATPSAHMRLACDHTGVVGYAICGRSGQRGYVQRLAVHPRAQGRAIGATLLIDGLRWLRRWGARDALVNTQEGNDRSLQLYQRTGFVLQPDSLAVLRIDLSSGAT